MPFAILTGAPPEGDSLQNSRTPFGARCTMSIVSGAVVSSVRVDPGVIAVVVPVPVRIPNPVSRTPLSRASFSRIFLPGDPDIAILAPDPAATILSKTISFDHFLRTTMRSRLTLHDEYPVAVWSLARANICSTRSPDKRARALSA